MKLTKRQLKRIIKEEYTRLVSEGLIAESYGQDYRNQKKAIGRNTGYFDMLSQNRYRPSPDTVFNMIDKLHGKPGKTIAAKLASHRGISLDDLEAAYSEAKLDGGPDAGIIEAAIDYKKYGLPRTKDTYVPYQQGGPE